MKRRDLIKELESKGFYLLRNGADHDIYTNGSIEMPVPRHKEINKWTAQGIIKQAEGK